MPRRLTNLLLFVLVLAEVASGLEGWLLPLARAWPLYDLHRLLGLALVLLLAWKYAIARGSLRRRLGRRPRDASALVGLAAGGLLMATLGPGLVWTAGLLTFDSFLGYSPLNLHVFFGLALLAPLLWHLGARWERRPAVPRLASRRHALRLLVLGVGAALSSHLVERVAGLATAPGARRHTGSRHAGSFSGNAYPVTMWQFDQVPAIDLASWRLHVAGAVAEPRALRFEDLAALPRREESVVLDCTGGWWSEQVWRGIAVGDLLAACGVQEGAREAEVVSTTGHRWTFPLDELGSALLATHVGGEALTPGHGYPLRLVVPGRRGFQWVKWVAEIRVT